MATGSGIGSSTTAGTKRGGSAPSSASADRRAARRQTKATAAFVATNSICQGQHVPILWPEIFNTGNQIVFAHTSFKWANLASHNAGVTVVIVGISNTTGFTKWLYSLFDAAEQTVERKEVANINAYLVPAPNVEVEQAVNPIQGMLPMQFGNHPYYGAALIFSNDEAHEILKREPDAARFIRPFYGSTEFIDCSPRACLWISDEDADEAMKLKPIAERVAIVKASRVAAGNGEVSARNKRNVGGNKKKKEDASAKRLADLDSASDITELRHVRPSAEKRAAEEIANRQRCDDFEKFKPLFAQVHKDIDAGVRQTRPFELKAEIRPGAWFIVGGQTAYVAEMGEVFTNDQGRTDARLRVVFDNGTESNMLMRSLQRSLNKDEAGRRITDPVAGPLFSDQHADDDQASGMIYVLRSKSDNPVVAANRDLVHKIGVTNMSIEQRIAGARLQPTFLMADVEVVATYELYNINRTKLENLIHRIFGPARLNIEIKDRFGNPVEPREWFLVPFAAIDDAVEKIKDGTIAYYAYDPQTARLARTD